VIVGGGFGGLAAARALGDAPARVILLDRTNHHLFQPLLYQVATSELSPADIAKPIRAILREQKNTTVAMSLVKKIDVANREVHTTGRVIKYDYLICAAGARHSYFGHDEWEQFAPGLKSLHDAIEIKHRVLTAFEQAEKYEDEEKRRSAMTFVIVGAGPTGVELAGAIADLAHITLKRDFRRIDPAHTRVILVEAGPRVLPMFHEKLSASAKEQLEKLNVEVLVNTPVTGMGFRYVELKGEKLAAHTIIWAAGNNASPLAKQLGCETDRPGRAVVNQDLTVPGHPEIQVVGDMACVKTKEGKPVPGVAPAAMQMGEHAGKNVLRQLQGKAPEPFWYFDKGSLATIGRHAGIADLKGFRFSGTPAWLAWAFIHLFFLLGFRNRLVVFFQWAWAYVTFGRGARVIAEPPPEPPKATE
jgi:NADH dehydrogenase